MDTLELIDEIDNQLKGCTGMTRDGHYQVQQIMQHYRKKVRVEQSKTQPEAADAGK